MRKKIRGSKIRHTGDPKRKRDFPFRRIKSPPDKIEPVDVGSSKQLRQDRLMLDETFGLIEYHARIIANWRMRVAVGNEFLLLDQAVRIVELIKSLPEGVAESTAGGHDQ